MQHGVVNTPEYRAMNPNGRVPTINDDGFVLWESNSIVRYLAGKHSMGRLIPSDLQGRADAERWMDWTNHALNGPMVAVFWGLIRTAPDKRDPAAIEKGRVEFEAGMRIADAHLAQRNYMTGGYFSVADIPMGCFAQRWVQLPIERPKLVHLENWLVQLAARPAFKKNVMLPLT
jgi:glutathione S-transferase